MVKDKPILILLAEDEPAHAEAIRLAFRGADPRIVVQTAGTLGEYRRSAADHPPDIAILDLSLPDGRAVEVLNWPPEAGPFPILIMTSFGNERTAVEAMKAGALDYIVKSPAAFAAMPRAVDRALREWNLLQERKRAEEELRRSEIRLKGILEATADGILAVDHQGKVISVNRRFAEMWRIPPKLVERGDDDALLAYVFDQLADPEAFMAKVRELYGSDKEETSVILFKDDRVFERFSSPLILKSSIVGRIWSFRDITGRKRAEDALRQTEENFRRSLDDSPLGVRIVNAEGETLYANRAILDIYGYDSIEELRATPLGDRYTPESYDEFQLRKEKRRQGEDGPSEYQISIVKKNGEIRRVQVFRKEVFWNGTRRFQTLYHDITEQKRAEEAVQAALREKEVLLREIHHRVKNNMQVISSLFNLQAGHIKDEEARRILKEGQTRIRSMGLIHEKLYQSRDLSKIDFSAYIRSLLVHLFHAYRIDANQVRLETELEDVHLDINAAVPCGLLVNELISNALKHAFPEGRKGAVKIGLRRRDDGAVELRVADNGVGFPEKLDFRRTESLGLQIVNLLIGQLDGTIELERKRGTAIVIAFQESGRKPKTA